VNESLNVRKKLSYLIFVCVNELIDL